VQLNRDTSVRGALAALTAALLGHTGAVAAGSGRTETSFLLYSESQRVTAGEGVFSYQRQLSERNVLHLNIQLDGLTGAPPNGATPSNNIQTFTRPSGQESFSVQPGEIPLDPGFHDTRLALDGGLTRQLDRLTKLNYGGHLSLESDYTSFGLTSGITRDLNRRNTTIGISGSISADAARPKGGSHDPFSSVDMSTGSGEHDGRGGERELEDDGGEVATGYEPKTVYDLVLGVSQVINRSTIIRLNYSIDHASGHLNDPYKILSVVQGPESDDPGEPLDYVYENRPSTRNKQAVYTELLRYLGGTTLDLSYRHFWDDWGVMSKTIDFFWDFPLGHDRSLQPHVRWYSQTQADFYRPFLQDGLPFPQYASADARLAKFDAFTYGLKYTLPVMEGSHLSATAEYYYQKGDSSPPEAFGSLRGFDLFPEVKALMLRIGYSHDL